MHRILIIEDDRKIAMALTLRLKSAGYEPTTAYDALTGVNVAVKNPPDLVVLDICLPVGNGFTVAEKIQALVRTPIPMIFITASKQPDFRQKATELGAAGYFEKPYEAEELLAAIHKALNPPGLAPRHETLKATNTEKADLVEYLKSL
jgi:DNA-binding response OmpR family regulator